MSSVLTVTPSPAKVITSFEQNAPLHRQVEALVAALQTILVEYRYLIAIAQKI